MNLRQFMPRSHEGYAACFAAAAVAIIVAALATMADAGGFRQASCGHQVVHQQAVVAAAIPYPVVGYQVGQYLQQQAVDEHAFRASPSKERLTFLEGYYQAKQEEIPQPQVSETETSQPQAFSAPAAPPSPPVASFDYASAHPTLAPACVACHSSDESKGGFAMGDVVMKAKAEGDCETILAMVDSIATGAMPKGQPMSDADRLKAINELLSK